jgi:hypothetical protein
MKKLSNKVASLSKGTTFITPSEAKIFGFDVQASISTAYIYLRYFDCAHQCFSDWDANELKRFTEFINKLRSTTWIDIYKSGGGAHKSGLGYTTHKDTKVLPNQTIIQSLSPDTTFFELRVTEKARVHGFRTSNAFCLIWLDRNHDVYKE